MQSLTRRGFLRATAFAAAPFGLAGSAFAIDPIGRTRPSHLKLSVAAYSYRDFLKGTKNKKASMDLFEFTNIAADMGVDAVELTSYYFPENVQPDYLHKLKQHCFNLGLDVSGTSVGNDFCFPAGADRDKNLALVRTWIDNAAELDAPVIRIFAGQKKKGQTEEEAVAQCVEGIKTSLKYAVEKGVTLALENHGGITATPEQLLKLVKAVDSPNFGINLDTGNFHGPDVYADLAQLAPYAVNVQVKTEINSQGKPKTDADLSRVIDVLRAAKYSGYVVLEYEAAEDPIQAIPRHIKKLRSLIS
jgi:sugar phosphate isomerase/epimerase